MNEKFLIIALAIVTTLLAWSQALSLLPQFRQNGLFHSFVAFLVSVRTFLGGKDQVCPPCPPCPPCELPKEEKEKKEEVINP